MRKFLLPFTLVTVSLVIGAACSKNTEIEKDRSFETRDLTKSATDVRLPRSLWQKIEAIGLSESAGLELSEGAVTSFAPITVYMTERNKGILRLGDTKVVFGPGGGEMDLSDFVEPRNGSFHFKVDFLSQASKADRKVFFLSNSVRLKVGDEIFGSGCNTYFDITSFAKRHLFEKGVLLNTSNGRHVSLLAGTYFFAAVHDGSLQIASLVVRDSTRRDYQCAPRM